jgi:hypothetical protein
MNALKVKDVFKPSDNQKNYINRLCQMPHAILCAKTGAGKTASVLYAFAWLKHKGALDNLIVLMPLSAYSKKVWQKDLLAFFNLTYITLDELISKHKIGKEVLARYDVILCKHTHVKQQPIPLRMLTSLSRVAFCIDEVVSFKNPKAQITKACTPVVKCALYKWFLTATPLTRNLEDTYYLTKLLNPQIFGTKEFFTRMYCTTYTQPVFGRDANGDPASRKLEIIDGIKDKEVFDKKLSTFLIRGENIVTTAFHYVDYVNSQKEKQIYSLIANGISMGEEGPDDDEDFLHWVMTAEVRKKEVTNTRMKSIERHSSRFIYLQEAADGLINENGDRGYYMISPKLQKLYDLCRVCVGKKNSMLIYFEYYSALHAAAEILSDLDCEILESSGTNVLDDKALTKEKCSKRSHIVLCTRAASESVSYYWLNHVCFFHVPISPAIFAQFVGRITRLNSEHRDNLHCWIFQSHNIDKYRLMITSHKAYQLELVSGPEENIPDLYKTVMSSHQKLDRMKQVLLWNNAEMG